MTPKYEIDRRYPFEATADSVCPVEIEGATVWLWFNIGAASSPIEANQVAWDLSGRYNITHFMVLEYPAVKRTAWLNVYSEEDLSGSTSKIRADGHRRPNCLACVKIEWTEGEGL